VPGVYLSSLPRKMTSRAIGKEALNLSTLLVICGKGRGREGRIGNTYY
jgi:hypothetical protein